jgi:hypothetical protein
VKLHDFYKKFDILPKEKRFSLIESTPTPSSLFVIFQQLTAVRAQKRYFEELEEHLLKVAEEGFNQIENGKSL